MRSWYTSFMKTHDEICPGCGVHVSRTNCQELMYQLTYYTLSLQDSYFIHQLIVDAYAASHTVLQKKPITTAFGLAGLYLVNERGFTGKEVQKAHMAMAKKSKNWPQFSPPAEKPGLTVRDVVETLDAEKPAMIKKWSKSVWETWKPEQEKVAVMVKKYLDV